MLCHDSSYQASLTFTFLALSGPGKLVFVWCGAITVVENSQLYYQADSCTIGLYTAFKEVAVTWRVFCTENDGVHLNCRAGLVPCMGCRDRPYGCLLARLSQASAHARGTRGQALRNEQIGRFCRRWLAGCALFLSNNTISL
jgi:hypothetical protein